MDRDVKFFHLLRFSVTDAKPTESTPMATPIEMVTMSFTKLCVFTLKKSIAWRLIDPALDALLEKLTTLAQSGSNRKSMRSQIAFWALPCTGLPMQPILQLDLQYKIGKFGVCWYPSIFFGCACSSLRDRSARLCTMP